jgi:hypothetical protein
MSSVAATLYRKRGLKGCFFISRRKITFERVTNQRRHAAMPVAAASQASRSCRSWLANGRRSAWSRSGAACRESVRFAHCNFRVGGITPGTRQNRPRTCRNVRRALLCHSCAESTGEGARSPHILWACEATPPLRRSSGLLTSA